LLDPVCSTSAEPAWAPSTATATALAVTSAGNVVTTVTSGALVTLAATVTTGTVSFLDTSNSNESLAVAPPTPVPTGLNLFVVEGFNPVFLLENFAVGDFNGDGIPDELVVCAYRRYRPHIQRGLPGHVSFGNKALNSQF
jgi:hypothetical protein